MPRMIAVALAFVLLYGHVEGHSPAESTRFSEQLIASVLERPEFAGSTFAILVEEVTSGKVILAHNPDTLLPPASTTKLVSCGGALAVLGPDFRFETPLVRTGPVENGVVKGDLVLVASGDPNLSQRVTSGKRLRFADRDHTYAGYLNAELVPGDPLVVLRRLVRDAVAGGIREVAGDLVVDDGLFLESHDDFVGDFSAICVNDNVVDMIVIPGRQVGDSARVEFKPNLPVVEVRCRVKTVEAGARSRIWVEPSEGIASFSINGTIPLGAAPQLHVGQLRDPAGAVAHYLGALLDEAGVRVRGDKRTSRLGPGLYRSFPVVSRHVSFPFSETVRVALKVSHNLHATMLPVVVGAVKGERGDRVAGYAVIRELLERGNVGVDSVILQSGSGGGHADRLTPRFLVGLLRFMAGRPEFREFYDALPIGGVDGTLVSRFKSPELRGRVRAKTGTLVYRGSFNDRWIYLSKALAGYLDPGSTDDPGERLAFAILIANTVTESRREGVNALFEAQEDILKAVLAVIAN